jgi:hypothetical protein
LKLGQHIEVLNFGDVFFGEGRIFRVPVDCDVTREYVVQDRNENRSRSGFLLGESGLFQPSASNAAAMG